MSNHGHLSVDRSRAFMLAGPIGADKTTLFNLLFGRLGDAHKTQTIEYGAPIGLDTPGEFFCHPRLYRVLIKQVASCIEAADAAVKAASVEPVRMHLAFGIGGKS